MSGITKWAQPSEAAALRNPFEFVEREPAETPKARKRKPRAKVVDDREVFGFVTAGGTLRSIRADEVGDGFAVIERRKARGVKPLRPKTRDGKARNQAGRIQEKIDSQHAARLNGRESRENDRWDWEHVTGRALNSKELRDLLRAEKSGGRDFALKIAAKFRK